MLSDCFASSTSSELSESEACPFLDMREGLLSSFCFFLAGLDRDPPALTNNASSSSSELSESTDSKGFLKLSTVSQNCTSKERLRLSINSMKYERELGLVNISRKDKRVVVGGSGNVDEVACESRLE